MYKNKEVLESFLAFQKEKFKELYQLTKAKNHDYAGVENNPFLNFMATEMLGNTSVEQGMIVRMLDKVTRIINLTKHDAMVKDESIVDTLMDLSNYAMLMANYIHHKKKGMVGD